jgi:hypothetical protein
MDLKLIAQHLVPALRVSLRAPGLCLTGLDGGRPLDDEQREPWIKIKYGVTRPDDWVGVVPATARFVRARGAPQETLDLIVKVNPRQGACAQPHSVDRRAQSRGARSAVSPLPDRR